MKLINTIFPKEGSSHQRLNLQSEVGLDILLQPAPSYGSLLPADTLHLLFSPPHLAEYAFLVPVVQSHLDELFLYLKLPPVCCYLYCKPPFHFHFHPLSLDKMHDLSTPL